MRKHATTSKMLIKEKSTKAKRHSNSTSKSYPSVSGLDFHISHKIIIAGPLLRKRQKSKTYQNFI